MYVFVCSHPKLLLRIYIFIWFFVALRLINYLHFFQKMFMLPDGVEVNRKVLSAVGEKVTGYKYALRCKYVKEDTTKEALYNLDISKRPTNISDQMWVGLVDDFFSDKFQVRQISFC